MSKTFNFTRLSGALALALGLAAPAGAVVVVGGDNGWEVSFDGNVNAFYTHVDADAGFNFLGNGQNLMQDGAIAPQENESRVTSGFLPAFFSFNVKSPTVNGLTGSARISFAPTIQNNANAGLRNKTSLYPDGGIQGATIDTREVLANIEGAFGTVSFGRTLSIFGRNAILNDMSLFGVGITGPNNGGVTAGRIGRGYVYPDFQSRFAYKTPNMNGFQAEVGAFDPAETQAEHALGGATGTFNETETPRFEGEFSYATAFTDGTFKAWVDGMYQELGGLAANADGADVFGVGAGANVTYAGFGLTGYYYSNEGTGMNLAFTNAGIGCFQTVTGAQQCEEADNDGWYVQGTYTFTGVTKVGFSYGESNQDRFGNAGLRAAQNGNLAGSQDAKQSMYTVGIYHDVTSWLKVIGEYSHAENQNFDGSDPQADIFSVGSFVTW